MGGLDATGMVVLPIDQPAVFDPRGLLVLYSQAREYLHYRVFGSQMMTPVAVMTSDAKGNHSRITELLQDKGWFGRGEGSFNLFCQPLVPVVSVENGKWLVTKPFQLMLKPGGHGVIWKLMSDSGVFDWLESRGREAALVRQIRSVPRRSTSPEGSMPLRNSVPHAGLRGFHAGDGTASDGFLG